MNCALLIKNRWNIFLNNFSSEDLDVAGFDDNEDATKASMKIVKETKRHRNKHRRLKGQKNRKPNFKLWLQNLVKISKQGIASTQNFFS